MSTADRVSVVLAAVAVALALVTTVRLLAKRSRRELPHGPVEPTESRRPGTDVRVLLVEGGRPDRRRWQVEVDDDRAWVDVFSYRAADGAPSAWVHELMDGPVTVEPGRPALLPGPNGDGGGAAGYVVAIGWSTAGANGRSRRSSLVSVGTATS